MSDDLVTNEQLAALAQNDRDVTAASNLGAQVAAFYAQLVKVGMKRDEAAEMTLTFNAMVVGQHFGVDVSQAFAPIPEWED